MNDRVDVSELVIAVRLALGLGDLLDCRAADQNSDSLVTITELIRAVGNALNGCATASVDVSHPPDH